MRTTCIFFALLLGTLACSKSSTPSTSTEPAKTAQPSPSASASTLSATVATSPENAALDQVMRALKAKGLDPSCVTLIPSPGGGRIEVEAREKHGGKCPGDPSTAPTIGRYRVSPSGDVTSYDVVSDSWVAVTPHAATSIVGTKVLEHEQRDSAGNHRFVLSIDRHGKTAHLYAYDFCESPPSAGAPCWTIQDGIDACEDDLWVDFVGDKLYLKENAGQLAAAVLYRTRCSSDLSAYTMKLVGYENGKKFAVRGTTGLRGEWDPKRTADVSDAALRPWALATWDKYAVEKL